MKEFLNKMHYGLFRLLLDIYEKCNPKNNNWQSSKRQQNFDNSIFYDYVISKTHHIFGYIYSGYFVFLSCILIGVTDVLHCQNSEMLIFILIAIPIIIGFIPMYKSVFLNDCYMKYFKIYKKKDGNWHSKLRWTTVAFIGGSILVEIFGIVLLLITYCI